MRTHFRSGVLGAIVLVVALLAAACGGSGEDTTTAPTSTATDGGTETEAEGPKDGPTITVASFNFPESVILAEIYAQALEHNGYPIEKRLDLGSRELIFPELKSGAIDFLPEYVGSSLGVGFGGEPTGDTQETLEKLRGQFEAENVTVLEPAPGQDKNVFVVTEEYAQEHDLETISDLANVEGSVVFGGPPECEERDTCLLGLRDAYGLENIEFRPIQEGSARIASLENGDIDLSLLFSTQPVIKEKGFVSLEDDQGIIPVENIVPVVGDEIVDAYGEEFISLVNSISELIETETLLDLNGQVELEQEDPSAVAQQWLTDNGFLDS